MTTNKIPQAGGHVWTEMPTPDALADEAMALHHILDLLIRVNFPPHKPVRVDLAMDLVPLLVNTCERARRLACDIDRLARS